MAELIHGTAIAFGARGVLLRGPSGAGKSDLALRCIALAHSLPTPAPPMLVADDQVLAEAEAGGIVLRPPATIAGLIEVRGVGIVRLPYAASVRLVLVVELVQPDMVERLPEPGAVATIAGFDIALARLSAFEASAPLKVVLALDRATGGPTGIAI